MILPLRSWRLTSVALILSLSTGFAESPEKVTQNSLPPSFDEDSVQNASPGIRIRQAAESYFYPKPLHSLIPLYGYRLDHIKSICENFNKEQAPLLSLGRIATVNDDMESRNGMIDDKENKLSESDASSYTLDNLCRSILPALGAPENEKKLVIAVENPLPSLMPTHRYLIDTRK